MDEKKYKRNAIKIIILFILIFVFIIFLPDIRSTVNIKKYEKKQQEQINKNKKEEEKQKSQNTLNTIICAAKVEKDPNYSLFYNKNGLQKYIKVTQEEIDDKSKEEKLNECSKEQDENDKGITTNCEVNNKVLSKSITYDFTKMDESYRKNNIFDFDYNESVEKIKKELENKEYTCG